MKQKHLRSFHMSAIVLVAAFSVVGAIKSLRIISPLKALTIWDPESKEEVKSTARDRFLPKFAARIKAEAQARREVKEKTKKELQSEVAARATSDTKDWATKAATADQRRRGAEERFIERASDEAAAKVTPPPKKHGKQNPNQYQFVGVVNPDAKGKPITWYARKKPRGAKWSVRLLHVDQAAVVTDLFRQGKVDVFAKYKNTGKVNPENNAPVVEGEYSVRERSFRNLWNFSPKHLFTDSSGHYWRERRLRPGMYTDGNVVYESSYRYRDGRNGMHKISTFQKFMNSKGINQKQKEKILKRLKADSPDVVLEE